MQGLLKADRFDWVVQKATELGVDRITPLVSERVVVSLAADRVDHRWRRWRRIAIEAAEQSGRGTVPEVDQPQPFDRVVRTARENVTVLFWEDAKPRPLRHVLPSFAQPLVVVVGPEGGFGRSEVEEAVEAGGHVASLGTLTLRSETAALAAIASIRALAQEC